MEAQRDTAEEKDKQITSVPELHLHLLDADLAEDVVSSYRRREAAWMSLATHGVIIALLLLIPKWVGTRAVLIPLKEKQETMIILPDDLSHPKTPPKTDIVSDKDRLASTPTPSKEALRKLLDARRPGAPKPPSPPPGQQMAQQQNPAPAQQASAPPAPPQQATQQAQLEAPKPSQPNKSPFAIASPGSSVNQAIQSVANGHTSGIDYPSGDYGSALHPKTERNEGMEILSDTLGVDFGPYMKRLHFTVQNHWDPLIPESALPPVMKKGVVVIQFSIGKDGRVMGMKLISSSGDVALDRAAWGAITDAIPLPKLPVQFAGQYLELRARFYYNPDKADMQ
ncbi:MAG TPA: energy transducer TonB [Candidatus Angelobacter sp.]|nr:energy transducer TonB [Candidatus Angelobacter sp.]